MTAQATSVATWGFWI
jgi:hypothetical protein